MSDLNQRLRDFLKGTRFEEVEHGETLTCEDSAAARGKDKRIGGKTLLLKDKSGFRLFTMSAALEFDSQKARRILSSQKLRFATQEELKDLTGAVSGALPPFGRPVQDLDLYVDQSVLDNEEIAFNAGLLTCSFIMNTKEWFELVGPHATLSSFTKESL